MKEMTKNLKSFFNMISYDEKVSAFPSLQRLEIGVTPTKNICARLF